jgi:hypothetical protein
MSITHVWMGHVLESFQSGQWSNMLIQLWTVESVGEGYYFIISLDMKPTWDIGRRSTLVLL